MKGKGIFILAGAAAVIYAISRNAKGLQQSIKYLQYRIAAVNFKISWSPTIVFKIGLYNPNDTAIPITGLFGKILSGNTTVATFNATNAVTVTPNKEEILEVSANISALTLVMKIISGQTMKFITIDGVLKTTLFNQDFNKTIDVTQPVSGVGTAGVPWWKNLNPSKKKLSAMQLMKAWKKARKAGKFKGGFLQYSQQYRMNPALITLT